MPYPENFVVRLIICIVGMFILWMAGRLASWSRTTGSDYLPGLILESSLKGHCRPMIGSWCLYAGFSDPNKMKYDFSFWRAGASVAGTALSAWLAHRRSRAALPLAGATAVGTIALGALNKRLKGSHVARSWRKSSLKEKIFNEAMPVAHAVGAAALVAGVAKSRIKARATAVSPLTGPLISEPWYPQARKLGLYFMGFSLLGHWVEILFCLGIKHGIFKGGYDRSNHMLWDQWLYPFYAEGTAAVLADLVLAPAKVAIQQFTSSLANASRIPAGFATPLALGASFLLNQIVCTSVDFGTGMVANRHYELWDYRDMRFHFMGQVCLQNSLFYSIIATWGVWWLLPALEKLMGRASETTLDGILVGYGSFFGFISLLHLLVPPDDGSPTVYEDGTMPSDTLGADDVVGGLGQ